MDLKKYKTEELNDRDKKIVELLSNGLTAVDISQKSNISNRTVENVVLQLKLKYNCSNTAHLVAHFLRKKIIK